MEGQPEVEWSHSYVGGEIANAIVQTEDGGYAMAGWTTSSGSGSFDAWLVKTDSQGGKEWSKTYGGENREGFDSAVQTDDGGYALVGLTESYGAGKGDFWLVKIDSQGNEEWSKSYGGRELDMAWSIAQTSDGGYAIAGRSEPSMGNCNALLVKTDSQGNEEWTQTRGSENDDDAYSIIQTRNGGYAMAGSTYELENIEGVFTGRHDFLLVKFAGEEKPGRKSGLPLTWITTGIAIVIILAVVILVTRRKS